MYDQPTLYDLLDAVRIYLEQAITPVIQEDRKLYYQTLVAINVLDIIERQIEAEAEHLTMEWKRLNYIQKAEPPMPPDPVDIRAALDERNRKLCEDINAGRYDSEPQR